MHIVDPSNLSLLTDAGGAYSKQTGGRGKMTLALIIGLTVSSVIVTVILLSTLVYICLWRRRLDNRQGNQKA